MREGMVGNGVLLWLGEGLAHCTWGGTRRVFLINLLLYFFTVIYF